MLGLVVAATKTDSGKTQVASALVALLADYYGKIAAGKVGPDYIDSSFLTKLGAQDCYNFDLWAMRLETCDWLMNRLSRNAGHLVIEGVMGLFDAPLGLKTNTAMIAKRYRLPVLLVVDSKSQAQSIACIVDGFVSHCQDYGIEIAAVLVNRVSSHRHEKILRQGLSRISVPVLGYLPEVPKLTLPHRHLGLLRAEELDYLQSYRQNLLEWFSQNADTKKILSLMSSVFLRSVDSYCPPMLFDKAKHICIASDLAFSFIYPHFLQGWRALGKRISYFSPLANETPNEAAEAIFLPGGYPELYACVLARNSVFKKALVKAAREGKTIYGECGGYMVLGEAIRDDKGISHAMTGLLPLKSDFGKSSLKLGYREIELADCDNRLSLQKLWRGHEFHYSDACGICSGASRLYNSVRSVDGSNLPSSDSHSGSVFGSYVHLVDYVAAEMR